MIGIYMLWELVWNSILWVVQIVEIQCCKDKVWDWQWIWIGLGIVVDDVSSYCYYKMNQSKRETRFSWV